MLATPDLGVIVGSGAGGIDVAERQYGDYYAGDWHSVSPYAIPGLHRRHRVERDLDRARPAWHQPRAVDWLHEFD